MSALPAYVEEAARPQRVPSGPSISVVPGSRSAAGSSASIAAAAKAIAVVLLLVAAVACIRVFFNAASVMTAIDNKELSSSIADARTEGKALEVSQSSLANPNRIKVMAASMGMAEPVSTDFVSLAGDVVVTDDAGTLLLSDSIEAAAVALAAQAAPAEGESRP